MDADTLTRHALDLRRGVLPEAPPWDIAAASQRIGDDLARPDPPRAFEVRAAAQRLNKGRHYEPARKLCAAWAECRGFDPVLNRHRGQALINLAALDAAERVLKDGLVRIAAAPQSATSEVERIEHEGLLARVAKQRFVVSGDLDQLVEATRQYLAAYAQAPAGKALWPGVNAVALMARLERESVDPIGESSAAGLATKLEAVMKELSFADDPWIAAIWSELRLAQGRVDDAELWLYRFMHHANVQPFDLDSYDRQLREIWQGNPLGGGPRGPDRLAGLMARHMLRTQSRISVSAPMLQEMARQIEDDPAALEKNFSNERGFSLDALRGMLTACASVGCVTNRRGQRLGTGFLVAGAALDAGFGEGLVFVTNAHVISDELPNAIRRGDALVSFEVESALAPAPVFHAVTEVLFTSPPGDLGYRCPGGRDQLDVTIVRLQDVGADLPGLKTAVRLPLIDVRSKAYVVGHPLGGGLQLSLFDSVLLDICDDQRLVHYRTPTDPGSSGSPVFNAQWEVIALHHAGSIATPRLHGEGCYEANEGIALAAIRAGLRERGQNPGSADQERP